MGGLFYQLGALGRYHRIRNRRLLTVLMFHRVLAVSDPRWEEADPAWSMSDTLFEKCLEFLLKHYSVIGIDDLIAALDLRQPLPERPVLITFDDGWADNEEYALRALKRFGLPATVFVVADAVGQRELWEDTLLRSWRLGRLQPQHCSRLWEAVGGVSDEGPRSWCERSSMIALIRRLGSADAAERVALFAELGGAVAEPPVPHMLSKSQLLALRSAGIALGSHGLTHTPIPLAIDPRAELEASRVKLATMLGLPEGRGPDILSFPHGIYDRSVIKQAFQLGYRLVFTSDACLNPISTDMQVSRVLGRITVPASQISDRAGRLCPHSLARWLFTRPKTSLSDGLSLN